MEYKTIDYSVADGILTITLNRPERMNSFTTRMAHEMIDALDRADADDGVGAIVVTGAGERAFCAGADLSGGADTFNADAKNENDSRNATDSIRDTGGMVTLRIYDCKKPVIAAINGAAVGVGVTMTLAMDIRLAVDTAKFGFVFAQRGIVPEACSSWFLPRVVGVSQALEWCFKGNVFPATEALEGGLVKQLYSQDELLPAAYQIARDIIDTTAPVSVALTRQMIWKMMGADHPMEAHKIDSLGVYERGKQADAAEGVESFLEKRPAVYPDTPSKDMPDFYPWWEEREFS